MRKELTTVETSPSVQARPDFGDHPGRVIRHEHGFIEYRRAPGNTVEIVNIEVHSDHRVQGVGRKLLECLFAAESDASTVYAITRDDNFIAQLFYEKTKFEVTAVLRRFYDRKTRAVDAIMYGRGPKGPV